MSEDWLREVERAGYSVQFAGSSSERTPLLATETRDGRCIRVFWIFFLVTLFFTGLVIGCYLIVEEADDSPVIGPYMLMNRAGWRAEKPLQPTPKFLSQLTHVVITQTSTDNCDNLNDCGKIIRDLQYNHVTKKNLTDIAYNFVIAGDGTTYEGRGWHHQPELDAMGLNTTLVIAFLGNFQNDLPTSEQIMECKILLRVAIEGEILDPCFTLTLFKERPQDGGGELTHVFNRIVMENNARKFNIHCSS